MRMCIGKWALIWSSIYPDDGSRFRLFNDNLGLKGTRLAVFHFGSRISRFAGKNLTVKHNTFMDRSAASRGTEIGMGTELTLQLTVLCRSVVRCFCFLLFALFLVILLFCSLFFLPFLVYFCSLLSVYICRLSFVGFSPFCSCLFLFFYFCLSLPFCFCIFFPFAFCPALFCLVFFSLCSYLF
jgi:hypothetical protein